MRSAVLLLACCVLGCNSSGITPSDGGVDRPRDIAMVDYPPTDVAGHGVAYGFVIDRLLMPKSRNDYAMDLNGDGVLDNKLGQIVAILGTAGLDLSANIDSAVANGTLLYLLGVQTGDPALRDDPAVAVTLNAANAQPSPDFTGWGTFTVDTNQPAARFFGALQAGAYSSEAPKTTHTPVTYTLKLSLFGGAPIALTVNGGHVEFAATTSSPRRLMTGRLHGSVKSSDIQTSLIPSIATLLDQKVAPCRSGTDGGACDSAAMSILSLLDGDRDGCMNPDGSTAIGGDGRIDACEVANNQLLSLALAPDVDIFDANGAYAPNPANTDRESISLGIGFTAVAADY